MDDRLRCLVMHVEPAVEAHTPDILTLWKESGEGNVDPRDLKKAISKGRVHVFQVRDEIVATAGIYPYSEGAFSELGSNCWRQLYRGLGGAPAAVDFRAVLASLYEPGTLVTSELYDTSIKSARVLLRQGLEEIFLIPLPMLEHAYEANPLRPVHHWVLSPWRVPSCARRLLRLIGGCPVSSHPFSPRFEFSSAYGFDNPALRAALERLARGELAIIGHTAEPPSTMEQWIAETFPDQVLTQDMFLASLTRLH